MPASLQKAAETALQEAMDAHGRGEFDEAQRLYESVLARDAGTPDALHLLGVLHAQRGRHEEAAALIGRAIALRPAESMFHNNLGNVCVESGRFDDAQDHYLHALELDAGRLDALNNLGVLFSRRARGEDAEAVLKRVIELAPDFADARQNLANHYLRAGKLSEAVQQCFDGLIVAPRSTVLRRVLGMAYTSMGRDEDAAAVYRAWLEAEPDNPIPRFHLAACTGQDGGEAIPDRAPDRYLTQVFDSFARSFDAKLAELGYQAPELVAGAVAELLGAPRADQAVLDAGCGTGLCGPLMKPYAQTLGGVDLSEGMLHKAVARQVYDELLQGELVQFLGQRRQAYDLIVSADTLCYFGALEAFAGAARQALRGEGLLVFTVEAHEDAEGAPDYRLHGHGRYSHAQGYLAATLAGAGFKPVLQRQVVLRMEANEPVQGWLVGARVDLQRLQ